MNDFIGVDVSGLKELQAKLAKLPRAVHETATRAGADEVVKVMRSYPAQAYVSRQSAYGVAFFTAKQRRYFFWALKEGIISSPYKRTNTLRDNWVIVGQGLDEMVVNQTPYAGLVMGDGTQNRMHQKIGWKTIEARLKENGAKIAKVIQQAADRAIRKLGL